MSSIKPDNISDNIDSVRISFDVARRAALAAALALSTAVGCAPAATDPTEPVLEPVSAVVMPFLSQMPFHIAQAEGYFEAEGIKPEFMRVGRSQDLMAALALGEVDAVAGLLTINELNTMAAGMRLRVVATLAALRPDQCDFLAIIARTGLAESGALEDPERVRQMVFDTDLLTPLGYQVDLLLRRYGLTIDEVEVVNLPPPAGVDAIQKGAVQAILENEPFLSQHLEAGTATVWVPAAELAPEYPHAVLIFGERLLDERPDLAQRFTTALLRGIRQFRQGKTERNLEIVERASGLAPDVVRRACWPVAPDGALANREALQGYQQWSVSRGLLDRVLGDSEVFDERFVRRAATALDASPSGG